MASEVEKLKQKLSAEICSNQKAAEYGLHLLVQVKSLQTTLQKQKTEHEIVTGKLKQQAHTLTGKLDATQQILKDQAGELELSKELYENMKTKILNIESEHNRQLNSAKKDKNQLESDCLERDNIISVLKRSIEELENQIHNTSKLHGTFSDTTDSFEQNLQLENQELCTKNQELQSRLFEIERDLLNEKESTQEMRSALQNMREEVLCKDNKLADCMLQKQESQEDTDLLRSELEILKLGQLDVKKRGNSLFAEVDDNRVALERELKTLRSQSELLKEKDEANQHEIKQMTHQISYLLNMSAQRIDSDYVLRLTQDLSQARGEIEELTLKLKSSLEKQQKSVVGITSPVEYVPKYKCEGYAFMNTLREEKNYKIESLLSELQSVHLLKTSLNNRLVQTDKQLYLAEKKNSSLKAEIIKLNKMLDALKKGDSRTSTRNAPEIRLEKIPGCQEKQDRISESSDKCDQALSNHGMNVTSEIRVLAEFKENFSTSELNAIETQLKKDSIISKERKKKCLQKVSFAVTDEKEDCSENLTEKKSKRIPVGKKADIPCVFVSSSDATTPSECAQQ